MGFFKWVFSLFSHQTSFASEEKEELNAVQQLKSSDPRQRKSAIKTLEKDDKKEVSQLERIRQIEEEQQQLMQKILILEHEKEQILGRVPKHSNEIITLLNQFSSRLHSEDQKLASDEQKLEEKIGLEKKDEEILDAETKSESVEQSKELDSVEHEVDTEVETRTAMYEQNANRDMDEI